MNIHENELLVNYFNCMRSGWSEKQLLEHPLTKSRQIFFHVTHHKNVESILTNGLFAGAKNGVFLAKNIKMVIGYGRNYIDCVSCPVFAVDLSDVSEKDLFKFREYSFDDLTILYPGNIDRKYIVAIADLSTKKQINNYVVDKSNYSQN